MVGPYKKNANKWDDERWEMREKFGGRGGGRGDWSKQRSPCGGGRVTWDVLPREEFRA